MGTRTRTFFARHSKLQTTRAVVAGPHMLELKFTAVIDESSTLSNPVFLKIGIAFLNSFFACPHRQQIPDLCIKASRSWLSVYTRYPNLLKWCFALLDGSCCRCTAHLFRDEHWGEFLVHFSCPYDRHFWTVTNNFGLCNDCVNRDQKFWFSTFHPHSSIASIKWVNELQCQCAC